MTLYLCSVSQKLIEEAVDYLYSWGWKKVTYRECLYKREGVAPQRLAALRVINPQSSSLNDTPYPLEIDFEKRKIKECRCGRGSIYSGMHLSRVLGALLKPEEGKISSLPVFITPDYIATWDSADLRWHLRYAVFGMPTLISLTGIVEAPARPREVYLGKSLGFQESFLEEKFKGDFLTPEDERLGRVLAGILLQTIFYFHTGEPFCRDKECSLWNSHWQKELIKAQDDVPYTLCPLHERKWKEIIKERGN